mmetsp:Transcript_20920/g.21711  ORF Transcript_20920/g.21711 Transcript_20920/m.21711 type:complete len:253 (+) Transcript_20920:2-760(+)
MTLVKTSFCSKSKFNVLGGIEKRTTFLGFSSKSYKAYCCTKGFSSSIDKIDTSETQSQVQLKPEDKESLVAEYKKSYLKHFEFQYQFTDLNYYKQLYSHTIKAKNLVDISSSLNILNDLIEYQHVFLVENQEEFLVDVLLLLADYKTGSYKMYYLIEEQIIKNIQKLSTSTIINISYAFILNEQGSKHYYNKVADDILKRKISNLTTDEFVFVYNTMSLAKLDNKMFWLIAEKANKEKYKVDEELLLKPYTN